MERECQFPILLSFRRFSLLTGPDQYTIDGAGLANWAISRFEDDTVLDVLSEDPNKAFDNMVEIARKSVVKGLELRKEAIAKAEQLFGDDTESTLREIVRRDHTKLEEIYRWASESACWTGDNHQLALCTKKRFQTKLIQAIDDKHFPEIRRMERTVLLMQLDAAWKEHLLAMDHVRSSVGFRGMGQMDPKVEYKREGMQLFDKMWLSIGEQLTDVIFRMEAMDAEIAEEAWVETSAKHEEFDLRRALQAEQASRLAEQERDLQEAEKAGAPAEQPIPTIRNRGERVGRNDPCPCNSGKKYKNCCMRQQV
jgi:preprotein translocase subunit SecA